MREFDAITKTQPAQEMTKPVPPWSIRFRNDQIERKSTMSRVPMRLGATVLAVTVLAGACSSSSKSSGAGADKSATPPASSAPAPASSTAASAPATSGSSQPASSPSGTPAPAVKNPKVAFMVSGTLGDLGFFDSAESGIKKAVTDLGITQKTVEGGANATATWLSDLQNLSNGNYDIVIAGSTQVADQLTQTAKQFPNQKYITFDQDLNLPNIASITYLQNDGAFLAGALAALVSEDTKDFPLSKGGKNVGIVGGQNIPVINDFIVGFKKGAQTVDPNIKVQVSYVGSFTDSQTGYNQAASMYAGGADVVFAAAGGAGLGVLKASHDKNKYSIGVDSNQNNLYPKNVLASDLKNVGQSLYSLLQKAEQGTLVYGQNYVFGISNGGVELAQNSALIPPAVAAKLKTYSQQVASGQVQVPCVNPYCQEASS
jgi:basic membrane protein A